MSAVKMSDQIRTAVRGSGSSCYQIAKDLKIDQATLSRFMTGQRGLTLKLLDRLAAYLQLDVIRRPADLGDKTIDTKTPRRDTETRHGSRRRRERIRRFPQKINSSASNEGA